MMPKPVLGGIVVISFGMVTSVGLSSLQFVNLSSGRNLCIIGLSLLLGLMIPSYLQTRKNIINTGKKHSVFSCKNVAIALPYFTYLPGRATIP